MNQPTRLDDVIGFLIGIFALVAIVCAVIVAGQEFVGAWPAVFAWMRGHVFASMFWLSAIGFVVCFSIGVKRS